MKHFSMSRLSASIMTAWLGWHGHLHAAEDAPAASQTASPVGVEQLSNSNDWVTVGGWPNQGHLSLGAPRTFKLNATWAF